MANAAADELRQQLKDVGVLLSSSPPPSLDLLLTLIGRVEGLLMKVDQAQSTSMKNVLLPVMRALISTSLSRHSNPDVRISLASCYTQLTRITAPDSPYDDQGMKAIFQFTVEAFRYLSRPSSHQYYGKAASILRTVAEVRSCLVMLDLGLDQLILEMFLHILEVAGSNHSADTFMAMESILTLVLDESEDISLAILTPLLASVRKDKQSSSPNAWKLGVKVLKTCAAKLKTHLKEAVQTLHMALDEYASVVADICQDSSHPQSHITDSQNCSLSQRINGQVNGRPEINLETGKPAAPRKRGRKPKSLKKIMEASDVNGTMDASQCFKLRSQRRRGRPAKCGCKDSHPMSVSVLNGKALSPQLKACLKDPALAQQLIGRRVKVWWPKDKTFYEGVVDSYDPTRHKHKILYADGDVERLNLKNERWELLEDDGVSLTA